MKQNPFSEPVKKTYQKIRELKFTPVLAIPSLIVFIALSIVLMIFIALWPYGLFPMIAHFIWELVDENAKEMKGKSFIDSMPNTVASGVYFIIWLPFFIVCLPLYTIGFIGLSFSGKNRDHFPKVEKESQESEENKESDDSQQVSEQDKKDIDSGKDSIVETDEDEKEPEMTDEWNCPKCYKANPNTSNKCNSCGYKLT